MEIVMERFEELLDISTRIHGHVCAGQVIGVRMAMLGLQHLAIDDPKGKDRKKLYVFVEIDRCATDAIQSVTGCSLGKRSLRWMDYGVMAATFLNLDTRKAVRITARETARAAAKQYCPDILDKYKQQLAAYQFMPEQDLFHVEEVEVEVPACDMPGRPIRRVFCSRCGDCVQDCREVDVDGEILCRACVHGSYYKRKCHA